MTTHLTIKQAVLSTLAYFELFAVAVTRAELKQALLFMKVEDRALDLYLKDSSYVHERDGELATCMDEAFWQEWRAKKDRTRAYFKKVARWRWIFSLCPFVKMVAVCNSLTIGDTRKNSDIDLFVIAQHGHLFTARFFLTALTSLFGVRRYGSKVKGRFCLSFYVTEEALNLSTIALRDSTGEIFDPYLAFWLFYLEPVSGSYEVYEQLLESNQTWLSSYFHERALRKRYFRPRRGVILWAHRFLEWALGSASVECFCRNQQWSRALKKYHHLTDKRGTVISDSMLKFHDHDAREEIRREWRKRVEQF